MPATSPSSHEQNARPWPAFASGRTAGLLAGALIVLAALAAYHNSFSGQFVYDDILAITENPTIHHLWPLSEALSPPRGSGLPVAGRPLVNFSLALNYAFGGTNVGGYHGVNLAIHVLAALVLFGVVRRTLLRPPLRERFGNTAWPLALAVAGLWVVHPLQTESVTYVVQRAESLMGLFYLLTLYGFIRGAEMESDGGRRCWYALAVGACLLGMASKEVMVSAPVLVLLYDRTFVAGSFRAAWQQRRGLYVGLAATWLLLGYLVWAAGSRGGTAGFTTHATWGAYALVQLQAIARYLWLTVWPHPLIFDYGTEATFTAGQIVPAALLVVALAAGTAMALWRRSALGFAGLWFFAILAPTSIVPVTTETMAEHRMYLALAPALGLLVLGLHAALGRRSLMVVAACAVGLGVLTARRNADYRSELTIWSDSVAKRPGNARAHFNLGDLLFRAGRTDEAVAQFEAAVRIRPQFASAHTNLANALFRQGKYAEAAQHAEEALRINPDSAEAHTNLGNALLQLGRLPEATQHYEAAVRAQPDLAAGHNNLGTALFRAGRLAEAIAQYEAAVRLQPGYPDAHYNLANTLVLAGRPTEAIAQYEAALRLQPDHAQARANLARLRAMLQRAGAPP